MVRASIIIPALNEEKNLPRVLPAVMAQLGPTDELIVVDNASTDQTAVIARSMGVSVVTDPIRSRARARNAGIRASTGEIIVFLDADCLPDENWLCPLLRWFDKTSVGAVAGEIINTATGSDVNQYLIKKGYLSQKDNFRHSFLPFGATANLAFRRKILNEIGIFDESLTDGEDADLCWRMQLETKASLVLADSAVVYHMQSFVPHTLVRQKRRHAFAAVALYKKYRLHWPSASPPARNIYWEYRSIFRRGFRFSVSWVAAKIGLSVQPPIGQGHQLLLEIGEKIGRLEGSLRYRVWFP